MRQLAAVFLVLLFALPLSANPTVVDAESKIKTVNELLGSNVCDGTLCPRDYRKQYCYSCAEELNHICTKEVRDVEYENGFYLCDGDECVLFTVMECFKGGTKTTGYPT